MLARFGLPALSVALGLPLAVSAQPGAGDGRTLLERGDALYLGTAGRVDRARAAELYREAAAAGDSLASLNLAVRLWDGRYGFERDRPRAAALAGAHFAAGLELARGGDRKAAALVGKVLVYGIGRARDPAEGRRWLRRAADQGDPASRGFLGWMYASGTGVEANATLAQRWLERAAEVGDCGARYDLAWRALAGSGLEKDVEAGLAALRAAAACEHPGALSRLGWLLLEGELVSQDVEEGKQLLEKAAARASDAATANLGYAYRDGVGVAKDPEKARAWLERAAELGSGAALNTLGWMAHHPESGAADLGRAVHLYVEAVGRGSTLAIGNLDTLLVGGRLEDEETEAIARRLEELAELGSAGAGAALAHFYYDGMLADPERREKAVRYALPPAEEGWSLAMWVLGRAYDVGHGVEQDQERATYWLERGAGLGSGGCMLRLGYNRLAGKGVPKDLDLGLDWLRRGAETGFLPAITFLAEVYERGHFGVERDPDRALAWYRKAAELGDEAARGRLRVLELERRQR